MRSQLVFGAIGCISNRFLLTRAASKATRKFHRPHIRIEDTVNDVLMRFTWANPIRRWSVPMEFTDTLYYE